MKLKFLGTGTSQGVPPIDCSHPVCLSNDMKDKRLRTSALITTDNEKKILIDCGPDFRQQMLNHNEKDIHAVLITHEHNDHIIGLDDLRPLIFKNGKNMPLYCKERVANEIKNRFPYAFSDIRYPGAPSFELNIIDDTFELFNEMIMPIDIWHSSIQIFGYKIRNLAYITDGSSIENLIKDKLKNLDYLIINCLRKEKKHHSHFILPDVISLVEELCPTKTYLTHMSHLVGFHSELEKELPPNIVPAYDGLEIEFY